MGATNTEYYTPAQNQLAQVAKALGHPARITIIEHLLKVGECICNDIVSEMSLSQPTISQHLRELKNVGLIKGNIEGNAICYCVNKAALEELNVYLVGLLSLAKKNKKADCC